MIIDCHAHACGENLSITSIIDNLNKTNTDIVVLVPGELNSSKTYKFKELSEKNQKYDILIRTNKLIRTVMLITHMKRIINRGNHHVYNLKIKAPDRIKQFYWLTKKLWNQIEEDFSEMNFDGIKLHQCWEYFKIESQWFDKVVKWSINHNLSIFIHLYSYKDVHNLIEVIKNYPKAKFIIAHFFGLEIYMKQNKSIYLNVYFDVSNCYFVSGERIKKAVEHFGSERIVMGSDTPYGVDALKKTIEQINDLDISSKDKENILGANMALLLKL